MRKRETEVEKIHRELFKDSLEHKYYTLGVAQGISFIHDLIVEFKDKNFTSDQWIEIIKKAVSQEYEVGGYFNRITGSKQKDDYLENET